MNLTRSLKLATAVCAFAAFFAAKPSVEAKPIFASKSEIDFKSKSGKKLVAAIETLVSERAPVQPLGIVVANIHDFPPELRQAAKSQLSMGERLQIVHIAPNSLAERLGLEIGDQLIQLNDLYVSRGQQALEKLHTGVIPRVEWTKQVSATIIRGGYGQTHSINPQDSLVDARFPAPQDS